MFAIKTLTDENGSILYEVNRMHSLDNHSPLKTFDNKHDAHNYVLKLIEDFKSSISSNVSGSI